MLNQLSMKCQTCVTGLFRLAGIGALLLVLLVNQAHAETMRDAIIAGNAARVSEMLANDPTLANSRDELGSPMLSVATLQGKQDIVEILLAKGADVNQVNEPTEKALAMLRQQLGIKDLGSLRFGGLTALHCAAQTGSKEIVEILIAHGADINSAKYNGVTPLHFAAALGNIAVAQVLLDHGAKVEPSSPVGQPLHWAAQYGRTEMARFLIERGADVNAIVNGSVPGGETPLMRAAGFSPNTEVMALLLERGARINGDEKTPSPIYFAVILGNKKNLEFLLEKGADPNARFSFEDGSFQDLTPLHVAASYGALEIVQMLVEHGADVNARVRVYAGEKFKTDFGSVLKSIFSGILGAALGVPSLASPMVTPRPEIATTAKFRYLTPLDWAKLSKQKEISDYLRKKSEK